MSGEITYRTHFHQNHQNSHTLHYTPVYYQYIPVCQEFDIESLREDILAGEITNGRVDNLRHSFSSEPSEQS